jgi:hypothetical protein
METNSFRKGLVAAGAALGLTLAGLGVSWAQTDDSTPPTTEVPAEPPAVKPDGGARRHHGPGARGVKGMGIHGEHTVRAQGGGYQTIATQQGEVTEVNATSLKVKSEDGYERTYVVDDDTMVNAGNDGIADVKVRDQVHVMAVVADGKANAKNVMDTTQAKALREKWAPARPARPAD